MRAANQVAASEGRAPAKADLVGRRRRRRRRQCKKRAERLYTVAASGRRIVLRATRRININNRILLPRCCCCKNARLSSLSPADPDFPRGACCARARVFMSPRLDLAQHPPRRQESCATKLAASDSNKVRTSAPGASASGRRPAPVFAWLNARRVCEQTSNSHAPLRCLLRCSRPAAATPSRLTSGRRAHVPRESVIQTLAPTASTTC